LPREAAVQPSRAAGAIATSLALLALGDREQLCDPFIQLRDLLDQRRVLRERHIEARKYFSQVRGRWAAGSA
jgi:hypothetical protein